MILGNVAWVVAEAVAGQIILRGRARANERREAAGFNLSGRGLSGRKVSPEEDGRPHAAPLISLRNRGPPSTAAARTFGSCQFQTHAPHKSRGVRLTVQRDCFAVVSERPRTRDDRRVSRPLLRAATLGHWRPTACDEPLTASLRRRGRHPGTVNTLRIPPW
jgi:hypothetical protein